MIGTTLLAGPPISQGRFAAGAAPGMAGGIALVRGHRLGWLAIGALIVVGFAANIHLMGDFSNCVWAG